MGFGRLCFAFSRQGPHHEAPLGTVEALVQTSLVLVSSGIWRGGFEGEARETSQGEWRLSQPKGNIVLDMGFEL